MKKSIQLLIVPILMLLFGVGIFGTNYARAQTSQTTQSQLVQKLLVQVQELQRILAEMQGLKGYSSVQKDTCLNIETNIGYRSTDYFNNNNVSALQDFLQAKGYLNSAPTGFYGLMTVEAVKRFQASHGIEQTGYLGVSTRGAIKYITCSSGSETSAENLSPESVPQTVAVDSYEITFRGDKKVEVVLVGKNLAKVDKVSARASGPAPISSLNIILSSDTRLGFEIPLSYVRDLDSDYTNVSLYDGKNLLKTEEIHFILNSNIPELESSDYLDYVNVYGINMDDVVKLEYRFETSSENGGCCREIEGFLSYINEKNTSYISFHPDRTVAMSGINDDKMRVRVINEYGEASNWVDSLVK